MAKNLYMAQWKLRYSLTDMAQSVRVTEYKWAIPINPRLHKDIDYIVDRNIATVKDKLNQRRADNLSRLRRTVHDLITTNNTKDTIPVFLTFTYKDNQENVDQAWSQWRAFMLRFNKLVGKKLKYVNVIQFQKRGAVHFHALFFDLPLQMEKSERKTRFIARCWGLGYVDVEKVRKARSVASYVVKYMYKDADDIRIAGRKAYTTSKGLLRPSYYYNQDALDKWFALTGTDISCLSHKMLDDFGNAYYTYNVIQ